MSGMRDRNAGAETIIGCALEVHKNLQPGLLDPRYDTALCCEMHTKRLKHQNRVVIPIVYTDAVLVEHRVGRIVDGSIIAEFKAVERMDPAFNAQMLSSRRLTNEKLGLLINCNSVAGRKVPRE